MRSNITGALFQGNIFRGGNKFRIISHTLGATFTMDADMPHLLSLDPGGADRTVLLPAEAEGLFFFILNNATAATTEDLVVKEDSNTTTIGTVSQGEVGLFFCDGTTWFGLALGTVTLTDLDLGLSGEAGSLDIFPSTAAKGKFTITATDQDGDTTVTLTAAAMGQASTISIPDPGGATANVLLTSAANDGVVVAATAAEIDRAADVSTRLVSLTAASTPLTVAAHEGRIIAFNKADGCIAVLPAATGSGAKYTFIVGTAVAGGDLEIECATNGADFEGWCMQIQSDGVTVARNDRAGASDNTFKMLDTDVSGGQLGDRIEVTDIGTDRYSIQAWITSTGTEASPFSAV